MYFAKVFQCSHALALLCTGIEIIVTRKLFAAVLLYLNMSRISCLVSGS